MCDRCWAGKAISLSSSLILLIAPLLTAAAVARELSSVVRRSEGRWFDPPGSASRSVEVSLSKITALILMRWWLPFMCGTAVWCM